MKPLQPRLFPAPASGKRSKSSQAATHEAANRESAALILADPARHGGEGALPVLWARAFALAETFAVPRSADEGVELSKCRC
jgi:hypothetical protein